MAGCGRLSRQICESMSRTQFLMICLFLSALAGIVSYDARRNIVAMQDNTVATNQAVQSMETNSIAETNQSPVPVPLVKWELVVGPSGGIPHGVELCIATERARSWVKQCVGFFSDESNILDYMLSTPLPLTRHLTVPACHDPDEVKRYIADKPWAKLEK